MKTKKNAGHWVLEHRTDASKNIVAESHKQAVRMVESMPVKVWDNYTGPRFVGAIKWVKDPEESYYKSECGRFEIEPLYCGRVRVQAFRLQDNKSGQKFVTNLGVAYAKRLATTWAAGTVHAWGK